MSFNNQTSVVTGGSAGLGSFLAESLCRRGADVVLVAREAGRLEAKAAELRERYPQVSVRTASIDLTSDSAVEVGFSKLLNESAKPVNALFNAAGISSRNAILDTTPDDFQRLWELNFLGTVRATRALAKSLIQQRGHVVNIGSLASKVASPYLGAYPASKFAVAAYSQQLRLELGAKGLHVLLVCPGPITRVDGGRRYDAEAQSLPESARLPGGGAKLKTIDPDRLVEAILTACERRKPELVIPGKVRLLTALAQFFPAWADRTILKKTNAQ